MALTVPNTNRIRATTESTVASAIRETQNYINLNVPQQKGTAVAPPKTGSRPIMPVAK